MKLTAFTARQLQHGATPESIDPLLALAYSKIREAALKRQSYCKLDLDPHNLHIHRELARVLEADGFSVELLLANTEDHPYTSDRTYITW